MNEDSIFMVNVEQYLLRSRLKRLPKTGLYCLFFMYMSFEYEKKKPKLTTNVAVGNLGHRTIFTRIKDFKYFSTTKI